MNEEEIKVKYILPFLESLGLESQDITLERSFKIKLGRYTEEIKWELVEKRPRYDILVNVDGMNLFVIEIKEEDHKISESDISQAVCYASLVKPQAPYAIVSNGVDTRIFDSIDESELNIGTLSESRFVKNGYKVDLDPEIRSRALSRLLTINYENLEKFCNFQNNETLRKFETQNKENLKKYIPEIYVNRHNVISTFYKFVDSENSGLMIDGNSGYGKTNTMCNLIKESRKSNPTFFYNASELTQKIEDVISEDFDWEFSTHKFPEQYFKQVNEILEKHDKNLFIFIDAIDEWLLTNTEVELSNFFKRIKDKRFKIVLSCKTSKLEKFLENRGISSSLADNLFVIDKEKNLTSLTLNEFSHQEVSEAVSKYEKYFSLKNEIRGQTLEECKNPSILRIVAETFREKEVPSTLDSAKIFHNYLENTLTKSVIDKERIKSHLLEITEKFLKLQKDEIFESELDISDYDAHSFVKDYGLIIPQKDEEGRIKIRFASEGLRNYIITYHQEKLDELSPELIEKFASEHISTSIGREILEFYKKNCQNEKHKESLILKFEEDDKRRAKEYLEKFIEITRRDFPFIIKKQIPDERSLGLLILYNEEYNIVAGEGFRLYDNSEASIVWYNKEDWFRGKNKNFDLMRKHGVKQLTTSSKDFTNTSAESAAYMKIFHLTKNLIKKRTLDETNNVGLAKEKFFSILPDCTYLFGLTNYKKRFLDWVLPIKIDKIRQSMMQFFINPEGGSIGLKHGFHNEISVKEVNQILDTLSSTSNEIDSTLLPLGDNPKHQGWYHINRYDDYSEMKLTEYVKQFFYNFIKEYRILVETNFPTIKNQLPTYTKSLYIAAQLEKSERYNELDGLWYAICENNEEKDIVEVRGLSEDSFKVNDDSKNWGFLIETNDGLKHTNSYASGSLDSFFHSYGNERFDNCPVVSWVYEQLNEDLKSAYGKDYGDIN